MTNDTNHSVARRGALALGVLLLAASAAACSTAEPDPVGGPAAATAIAQVTQAALDAGAPPTPVVVNQATAMAMADIPEGMPGTDLEGSEAGSVADMRATQEAAEAAAQIADVDSLVQRQEPLATFTPGPSARLDGRLLFVRNGAFYTASAAGGDVEALDVGADVPAVWSPPDDPGRAWLSPDGDQVAFLAGPDAELWVVGTDGRGARAVSGPNLPTGKHEVKLAGGASQDVRLQTSKDYTLVRLEDADEPFAVLVDNNERHVRGSGRLRVVHAVAGLADESVQVTVGSAEVGMPVRYGAALEQSLGVGQHTLRLTDSEGTQVGQVDVSLADRDLKTLFLVGDEEVLGVEHLYEAGSPASRASRVRVFNGSTETAEVAIDEGLALATSLEPGDLGTYVSVPSVSSEDELEDLRYAIYGLRYREQPIAWSPDGRRLAFLGGSDGQIDLYVSEVGGTAERLTSDGRTEVNPVWSPGSRHLAWVSIDPSFGQTELYVLVDGESEALSVDVSAVRAAAGASDTAPVALSEGARWADDSRLFFFPSASQASVGLWLYDVANGELTQAYDAPLANPVWSDEALAWAFAADGDAGEIVVLELDGQATQIVAAGGHRPQWLPGGDRLSWVEGEVESPEGWRIHVTDTDGTNDVELTGLLPLMQEQPPWPGTNAKRSWLDDGDRLLFSVVGPDYGRAERSGNFRGEAGSDIENYWLVDADGATAPRRATDLTKVFYLQDARESPDGDALAFIGFSYLSRTQLLWTVSDQGGKPVQVDAGVRWYTWLR